VYLPDPLRQAGGARHCASALPCCPSSPLGRGLKRTEDQCFSCCGSPSGEHSRQARTGRAVGQSRPSSDVRRPRSPRVAAAAGSAPAGALAHVFRMVLVLPCFRLVPARRRRHTRQAANTESSSPAPEPGRRTGNHGRVGQASVHTPNSSLVPQNGEDARGARPPRWPAGRAC
jgi:hypothetical protein